MLILWCRLCCLHFEMRLRSLHTLSEPVGERCRIGTQECVTLEFPAGMDKVRSRWQDCLLESICCREPSSTEEEREPGSSLYPENYSVAYPLQWDALGWREHLWEVIKGIDHTWSLSTCCKKWHQQRLLCWNLRVFIKSEHELLTPK